MGTTPSYVVSSFSSFDALNMRVRKTISSQWRRYVPYCLTYLDTSAMVYMPPLLYQDWPCLIEFNSINMPPYLFFFFSSPLDKQAVSGTIR